MRKFLHRLVAVLLVPCLIMDSVGCFAITSPKKPPFEQSSAVNEQALSSLALTFSPKVHMKELSWPKRLSLVSLGVAWGFMTYGTNSHVGIQELSLFSRPEAWGGYLAWLNLAGMLVYLGVHFLGHSNGENGEGQKPVVYQDLEIKIFQALSDGPLTGKQLMQRFPSVPGNVLWQIVMRSNQLDKLFMGTRYPRIAIKKVGPPTATLSPSPMREFYTYTVIGQRGDSRVAEKATSLQKARKTLTDRRLYEAGTIVSDLEHLFKTDHLAVLLSGDAAHDMAHNEPRRNPLSGQVMTGSDFDFLILLPEDTSSEDIQSIHTAFMWSSDVIASHGFGSVEVDHDVFRLNDLAQLSPRKAIDLMHIKNILQSRFVLGDETLVEKAQMLLGQPAYIDTLDAVTAEAHRVRDSQTSHLQTTMAQRWTRQDMEFFLGTFESFVEPQNALQLHEGSAVPAMLTLELGGSRLRVGISDSTEEIVSWEQIPIPRESTTPQLFQLIMEVATRCLLNVRDTFLVINMVGVATPGVVFREPGAREDGSILYASRLPLTGVHLRHVIEEISRKLLGHDVPVFVNNDVEVGAVVEAAQAARPFIFLNLGTGINASIAHDDEIIGIEFGEQRVSGGKLRELYSASKRIPDESSRIDAIVATVALPLSGLIRAIDIHEIVLGGGLLEAAPHLKEKLTEQLKVLGINALVQRSGISENLRGIAGLARMGTLHVNQLQFEKSALNDPLTRTAQQIRHLNNDLWRARTWAPDRIASASAGWEKSFSDLQLDLDRHVLQLPTRPARDHYKIRILCWQFTHLLDQAVARLADLKIPDARREHFDRLYRLSQYRVHVLAQSSEIEFIGGPSQEELLLPQNEDVQVLFDGPSHIATLVVRNTWHLQSVPGIRSIPTAYDFLRSLTDNAKRGISGAGQDVEAKVDYYPYNLSSGEAGDVLRVRLRQPNIQPEDWHRLRLNQRYFLSENGGPSFLKDVTLREHIGAFTNFGDGFRYLGLLLEKTNVLLRFTRDTTSSLPLTVDARIFFPQQKISLLLLSLVLIGGALGMNQGWGHISEVQELSMFRWPNLLVGSILGLVYLPNRDIQSNEHSPAKARQLFLRAA